MIFTCPWKMMKVPKKYIHQSGYHKGKIKQKLIQTGKPRGYFKLGTPHPFVKSLFYVTYTTRAKETWGTKETLEKRKQVIKKLYTKNKDYETSMTKTVGISLGGGGAKGLAHIAILEALDEMDIKVGAISGTSIGAIIGTLYASGLTGRQIRDAVDSLLTMPGSLQEAWAAKRTFGWLEFLNFDLKRSHLLHVVSSPG